MIHTVIPPIPHAIIASSGPSNPQTHYFKKHPDPGHALISVICVVKKAKLSDRAILRRTSHRVLALHAQMELLAHDFVEEVELPFALDHHHALLS